MGFVVNNAVVKSVATAIRRRCDLMTAHAQLSECMEADVTKDTRHLKKGDGKFGCGGRI